LPDAITFLTVIVFHGVLQRNSVIVVSDTGSDCGRGIESKSLSNDEIKVRKRVELVHGRNVR
jgi:hypothetical protein